MEVTLYMMITGICPLSGNGIYDTYEKIQNEHPPIPTHIDQNMHHFLDQIVLKDPDKRITLKQLKQAMKIHNKPKKYHYWFQTKGGTHSLCVFVLLFHLVTCINIHITGRYDEKSNVFVCEQI
eukprot:468800_1